MKGGDGGSVLNKSDNQRTPQPWSRAYLSPVTTADRRFALATAARLTVPYFSSHVIADPSPLVHVPLVLTAPFQSPLCPSHYQAYSYVGKYVYINLYIYYTFICNNPEGTSKRSSSLADGGGDDSAGGWFDVVHEGE